MTPKQWYTSNANPPSRITYSFIFPYTIHTHSHGKKSKQWRCSGIIPKSMVILFKILNNTLKSRVRYENDAVFVGAHRHPIEGEGEFALHEDGIILMTNAFHHHALSQRYFEDTHFYRVFTFSGRCLVSRLLPSNSWLEAVCWLLLSLNALHRQCLNCLSIALEMRLMDEESVHCVQAFGEFGKFSCAFYSLVSFQWDFFSIGSRKWNNLQEQRLIRS